MTKNYIAEFERLEKNISNFMKEMRIRHIKGAEEFGLSVPQFVCIWTISKIGKVKMSDIADVLALSSASATSLVNKLCDLDFLTRYDEPSDRRVVYVELTEKGRNLTNTIRNRGIENFNNWYSKSTTKEKEHLENGLNCILKALIPEEN
ncbi:MAG: MarR family transcriptional regulator [Candidatus Sericytochromatia bacterium]